MALIANKKSVMTLFSGGSSIYSHRTRMVLAEKGISVDVIEVGADGKPEDLLELNPYGSVPTLVDRDLVLYDSQVIMEYLDERFPHPPLMPVDPVSRARTRLMLYRINKDIYSLVDRIDSGEGVDQAKKELAENLVAISPVFDQKPFFMSDEFSLMDCALAPVLWRLKVYGVELPDQAKAVSKYAKRVFDRAAFRESLTNAERDMRAA